MNQGSSQYLALGDSYTIGEQVPLYQSFPYQLVQRLRKKKLLFSAPEIIAETGWTTAELLAAMEVTALLPAYDLVTLLIGVNNQYRGYRTDQYVTEFRQILTQAIRLSISGSSGVRVLSIPDWSVTPFAEGRGRNEIAKAIDEYNDINQHLSAENKVAYIEITSLTRKAASDQGLLAGDGLHPSGRSYAEWVDKLAAGIPG